ncbi:chaplin [Streptomyces sp. NPDC054863]
MTAPAAGSHGVEAPPPRFAERTRPACAAPATEFVNRVSSRALHPFVQVPVHVPVNATGNTVNVIGALNPAFGNESSHS